MAEIIQLAARSGGPNPVGVWLTEEESRYAASVGVARQLYAIRAGLKDAHGANPDRAFDMHIQGAAGEFVASKALNVHWQATVGSIKGDDVGRFQVRMARGHGWWLRLHPKDPDDRPFILVTGRIPLLQVHGWVFARDGKKPDYWRAWNAERPPAYWVPQAALRPLAELRAYLRREDDIAVRLTV